MIHQDTIQQPDILVICGPVARKFLDFPPLPVVESLSPSTTLNDHQANHSIWESQGIRYNIIVDPQKMKQKYRS